MSYSQKKTFSNISAERGLDRFRGAIDEFDCHWDEHRFDEILRQLIGVERPDRDRKELPKIVPVRCDECFLKAELVQEGSQYVELWSAETQSCRHLPIERCISMKAVFVRARGGG